MAKYALFFSYTPQTWAALIAKPSDRAAAASAALEAVGASMESLYFMFGERDGFVIFDAPDSASAAAAAIAVGSTGAFAHLQTHELIAPEDLAGILGRAASSVGSYQPPGA